MKKIININFQGRVIPIEETAYDILKQYIESLRVHFEEEEGHDEIINDIESRIGELFSERLKNTACITDNDTSEVIAGIGRPEDLKEAEAEPASAHQSAGAIPRQSEPPRERRLFRSANDQFIGGVCAGLAYYLKIDPTLVRVLFLLITFGGFGAGVVIYLVLWIVLPSQSLASNTRKRLFRNPDDRIIGGVASGLASYFNTQIWIPRLVFALPFVLGIITSLLHFWPLRPFLITGGFGGTLIIIYIILWIIVPEARTASEKLEMRGEAVNLDSIKSSVQEGLSSIKNQGRAFSTELREKAAEYGSSFKQNEGNFRSDASSVTSGSRRGLANAIIVLSKVFIFFLAGIISFALITALIAILFSESTDGFNISSLSYFILDKPWHGYLAWGSLILLLGIPAIALLTWLVRRVWGIHSRRPYWGYVFSSLWIIGIIGVVVFISITARNFSASDTVEEDITLSQPSNGKLFVNMKDANEDYRYKWRRNKGVQFLGDNNDSLLLKNVRIEVIQSKDTNYYLHRIRSSDAPTKAIARDLAGRINFNGLQHDSILLLPEGFVLNRNDKFRNQQVMLVIEVPVGKKIELDRSVRSYSWFTFFNTRDWDGGWRPDRWKANVEYIMTPDGLEKTAQPGKESETGNKQVSI